MAQENSFRLLIEKVKAETDPHVYQITLPVKDTELSPVLSKDNIDLHYGILYKNYVTKALDGEGEFQIAGAVLHTIFFEQFQKPRQNNNPNGSVKSLIEDNYTTFENFKNELKDLALTIHGSGWIYLSKSGELKIIHNHKVVKDAILLIDMWEHSYILDYGADKEKYLKNIWKIINWDIINVRFNF